MLLNTEKFNNEIRGLKGLKNSDRLHPLKKEQIKQAVLGAIAEGRMPAGRQLKKWLRLPSVLRYALAILAGIFVVGGTAFAAQGSVPGDILYPVKKAAENVQLHLAATEQAKAELQIKFAQERINELSQISTELAARPTSSPPSQKKLDSKARAEQEAGQALMNLHQEQDKLQSKGSTTTAESLNKAIQQLQGKLHTSERSGGSQNNSRSSAPSQDNRGRQNRPLDIFMNATTTPGIASTSPIRATGSPLWLPPDSRGQNATGTEGGSHSQNGRPTGRRPFGSGFFRFGERSGD